jgi:hypothetical protein
MPSSAQASVAFATSRALNSGDDGGAELRADLVLVDLGEPVDGGGRHDPLLDHDRLQRLHAGGDLLGGPDLRTHQAAFPVVVAGTM